MIESLSTKEREYILKSESDFDAYEKKLVKDKSELQKSLDEAKAKLDAETSEKLEAKLEEEITTLEAQIKELDKKITGIPAKKTFIELYGPTKWTIKSIGRRRKFALMSSYRIGEKKGSTGRMGEYMCAVIDENLVKWENLRDKDGNEIPFSKDVIDHLPDDAFSELFGEITGAVDEATEKN